jgi:hypothetical protein
MFNPGEGSQSPNPSKCQIFLCTPHISPTWTGKFTDPIYGYADIVSAGCKEVGGGTRSNIILGYNLSDPDNPWARNKAFSLFKWFTHIIPPITVVLPCISSLRGQAGWYCVSPSLLYLVMSSEYPSHCVLRWKGQKHIMQLVCLRRSHWSHPMGFGPCAKIAGGWLHGAIDVIFWLCSHSVAHNQKAIKWLQ